MLNCDKIHPQLAFQHSGMFSDSEGAYSMSMKYHEEQKQKALEEQQKMLEKSNLDGDNDNKDKNI